MAGGATSSLYGRQQHCKAPDGVDLHLGAANWSGCICTLSAGLAAASVSRMSAWHTYEISKGCCPKKVVQRAFGGSDGVALMSPLSEAEAMTLESR